jgi:hypothetical protein
VTFIAITTDTDIFYYSRQTHYDRDYSDDYSIYCQLFIYILRLTNNIYVAIVIAVDYREVAMKTHSYHRNLFVIEGLKEQRPEFHLYKES